MDLIGFVGFQNAGKNTAALPLENLGYQQLSYADSLKDCLAAIFQWPRDMLSGVTPESRFWREQTDEWWAEKLGLPDFTRRKAMQIIGTDVLRTHFHNDLWVLSAERKIELNENKKFVFTDLRYPNEINLIKNKNGKIFRIKKGDDPEWYSLAEKDKIQMKILHPEVHETEYAWIGSDFDAVIENNSTVEELHKKVLDLVFR